MLLTDIAPLETWFALEQLIHDRSGLNASVFDAQGRRLRPVTAWANRLCSIIKNSPEGQSQICACAHQVIAAQARARRAPSLEACDAGLLKFACPILHEREFLGVVGGCGLLLEDVDPDLYYASKITRIPLEQLEAMVEEIGVMHPVEVETLIALVMAQTRNIVTGGRV